MERCLAEPRRIRCERGQDNGDERLLAIHQTDIFTPPASISPVAACN
jgi:hypothetical protein